MSGEAKTALVLVDVINSFFQPGHPNYYPGVEEVLPALRALLDAARSSGAIVVHAAELHRPAFDDFEWRKLPVHHLAGADRDGRLSVRTSFMIARIMHTGETTLFATGSYRDRVVLDGEQARFAERTVILDSRQIDTLLAIPL